MLQAASAAIVNKGSSSRPQKSHPIFSVCPVSFTFCDSFLISVLQTLSLLCLLEFMSKLHHMQFLDFVSLERRRPDDVQLVSINHEFSDSSVCANKLVITID